MKVIFLDFDGVITVLDSHWQIRKSKADMIQRIMDETGAKIVISSSWGISGSVEKTLAWHNKTMEEGGPDNICRPFETEKPTWWNETDIVGVTRRDTGYCRGQQIANWMVGKDIENYVILDDDHDMLTEQMDHYIQTHCLDGIDEKDVIKAIKILNNHQQKLN